MAEVAKDLNVSVGSGAEIVDPKANAEVVDVADSVPAAVADEVAGQVVATTAEVEPKPQNRVEEFVSKMRLLADLAEQSAKEPALRAAALGALMLTCKFSVTGFDNERFCKLTFASLESQLTRTSGPLGELFCDLKERFGAKFKAAFNKDDCMELVMVSGCPTVDQVRAHIERKERDKWAQHYESRMMERRGGY
jgi:hypothetical protein